MNSSQVPEIVVRELARKLGSDESFILLDVREAWELDQAMIVDSRLKVAPMSRLAQLGVEALPEEVRRKDAEVLVLCHHGIRSLTAAQWLRRRGFVLDAFLSPHASATSSRWTRLQCCAPSPARSTCRGRRSNAWS